ncbi:MAG: four helix bundle protein [bacterium]
MSNEMETKEREYDLEERLVTYAALVIELTEALPDSRAGNHIAVQLLRSGTSPAPNYGEAEAAESRKDFLHKMGICLKELRESRIWLRVAARRTLLPPADLTPILNETEELIRIFNASIATAKRNS